MIHNHSTDRQHMIALSRTFPAVRVSWVFACHLSNPSPPFSILLYRTGSSQALLLGLPHLLVSCLILVIGGAGKRSEGRKTGEASVCGPKRVAVAGYWWVCSSGLFQNLTTQANSRPRCPGLFSGYS